MSQDLVQIQEEIGRISTQALEQGGTQLLDKVEAALGVALRHLKRISEGTFKLTPAVEAEINYSLSRGRQLIKDWEAKHGRAGQKG